MTKRSSLVRLFPILVVCALAAAIVTAEETSLKREPERQSPPALKSEGAYKTVPGPAEAGGKGRYRTLLRKINVPADRETYGDFYDYGYWTGTAYAGQTDLPAGYWVYLAPDWYIFKTCDVALAKRSWGPEQATGAPDTASAGDLPTAWASATQDAGAEWLDLEYASPVQPLGVLVYETFNPGAVNKVSVYDADGAEHVVWTGTDPTAQGCGKGVSSIAFTTKFKIARVRIWLDSPKVAGWNEIDAVGLLDEKGTTHWAVRATASSTYAERTEGTGDAARPER